MRIRRRIVPIAVALIATMVAIAAASAASNRTHAAHAKKFKIALANSFIGNTWRLEMENTFKAACKMPPFSTEVSCSVYNSGNDVGKQTQQISNLISEHVDAIVIDAASPTGLNGIVKQACARGILVISFDNIVTDKCGLTVNTNQLEFGQLGGQYLADQLHGKGNIVMVTGVAGTSVDADRNKGVESVLKKYPGMKISAHFSANWDSATAQRVTAAQLPSLPHVDGVWVSGGTDGVVKAFIAAGKPVPIVAGEGENGYRRYLLAAGYNGHHVTGISIGQPPFLSVASLELAREILQHKHAKKSIVLPFPVVNNKTVKSGVTVFPALPDSFFADFTDSGPKATVVICVQAALKGTPCPGSLNVLLP
jgi:ribose transport system substrate-binding protein